MFGCLPGVFINKKAAELVSQGYGMEEGTPWTVIEKLFLPSNHKIYKPCRVDDYDYSVKQDGWVISE